MSVVEETIHTPVAIVGAGACGLTAALALHRQGIECVVLERDAVPAGSTALSSGFVPAPATRVQKAAKVEDSPELFAQDIQHKAHGQAAPVLVKAYSEAIGTAMDDLEKHHHIPWQLLDQFLYPGHSVHRMHAVPEKTGEGLMTRLRAAADAAGVVVLTQAQVTALHADDTGRINSLSYSQPDGATSNLNCDAVILACNGFGGNADMVKQHLPAMKDAQYAGHVGNDGSAVAWGLQLGAALADMGAYQGHGSWAIPQGSLISWALMMEGGVQINALGQRFHDETQGYSEAAVQVLNQPEGVAWNVFDNQLLRFAQDFPDFVAAQAAGAVKSAADVASLAAIVGCPVETLANTLSAVNPNNAKDAWGRTFKRALEAPFHAIKVTGALFHTQGGLNINGQCQVLKPHGEPLPNLYAAGGAARGVSGAEVWGYLSGNGLLSAIAGGHIAALAVAQTISEKTR
ncbi:FAD-dependent oxidoreductase [Limnohabitans sp. 103DPR2]|uniref:FAD-dependent oxidoreductase n=1 Tax=Limnohabitans sp. 103DPR2 TaxID=1678129 RepID=UPI0006DBD9DC|nr:FAD-dependent oxidoreductase [Limnohabitans sp. 103DPR2]ALK93083.1 Fumarate reductase flavoprotein subunit precursor [Limnohabitans sp. 103DPR2]